MADDVAPAVTQFSTRKQGSSLRDWALRRNYNLALGTFSRAAPLARRALTTRSNDASNFAWSRAHPVKSTATLRSPPRSPAGTADNSLPFQRRVCHMANPIKPRKGRKNRLFISKRRGHCSFVPAGLIIVGPRTPAMNRWAIVGRPCGTGCSAVIQPRPRHLLPCRAIGAEGFDHTLQWHLKLRVTLFPAGESGSCRVGSG